MKSVYSIIVAFSLMLCASCFWKADSNALSDDTLRHMAAKMLMVGFKGDTITDDNPVVGYLSNLKVGGVILFDIDLTGSRELGSRNITTAPRLSKLTAQIRELAPDGIIIAADQEGGRVQRLKPQYGFLQLPAAQYLGAIDNPDTTAYYADIMAKELVEAGINLNLAPDLDLHSDSCPVIGLLERAYSSEPEKVTLHAGITIDHLHQVGILTAVKHFPGHGSANADSHYGLTDVTATWSPRELEPFKQLIANGKVDMVMTAHIFNRQLDSVMPATLSPHILTDILRESFGFKGIILTDDMYMQGIIDNYSIEEAVIAAINAGADMLIMGNNISTGFEPERPYVITDMIVKAVKDGKIPQERIVESYNRIVRTLNSLKEGVNN